MRAAGGAEAAVRHIAAVGHQAVVAQLARSAALGKQTLTVALPAPMYWHTRHQQVRVTMGAALME